MQRIWTQLDFATGDGLRWESPQSVLCCQAFKELSDPLRKRMVHNMMMLSDDADGEKGCRSLEQWSEKLAAHENQRKLSTKRSKRKQTHLGKNERFLLGSFTSMFGYFSCCAAPAIGEEMVL
eukprot:Skav215564  [mRNA]  locus=scaffold1793:71357:71801:- [translate_table: standard]